MRLLDGTEPPQNAPGGGLKLSAPQIIVPIWFSRCACPGRFSMVDRGLVTFCDSKQWTKQAAARGAGNRRFWRLSTLRAHTNAPCKYRFTMQNAKGA